MKTSPLPLDIAKLQAQIDDLAAISEWPSPAVTRVLFSEADLRAPRLVHREMRGAGS